jgi:putative heme iron utilization protein
VSAWKAFSGSVVRPTVVRADRCDAVSSEFLCTWGFLITMIKMAMVIYQISIGIRKNTVCIKDGGAFDANDFLKICRA